MSLILKKSMLKMNTEMDHGNEDKYENICLYYVLISQDKMQILLCI